MAPFQTKIGWKRPRNRENKNYRSVRSYPMLNERFKNKSKNIQKIKKNQTNFICTKNRLE